MNHKINETVGCEAMRSETMCNGITVTCMECKISCHPRILSSLKHSIRRAELFTIFQGDMYLPINGIVKKNTLKDL